jgi:hypothetical protein
MQSTKVLAAGIVVLLAVGGVAAADTGVGTQTPNSDAGSVTNVNAYAAYENGTVTVTVTDAGEPLENVSVFVAEERVGTTDANGTATFDTTATEELELELAGDQFEAELEYTVEDGSLRLVEEEYEYQRGDEMAGDEHESEEERRGRGRTRERGGPEDDDRDEDDDDRGRGVRRRRR